MNGLIALLGSGEYLPVMDDVDRYLLANCGADGRANRAWSVCQLRQDRKAKRVSPAGQRWELNISPASGLTFKLFLSSTQKSANDLNHASAVEDADLIYFSGGNPSYLYRTMKDSLVWQAAQKAWARGAVYAGCSAGAMILGREMPDFRAAGIRSTAAFGILPVASVMPHFNAIPLFGKPLVATLRRRLLDGEIMIGIDEDTAIVGKLNEEWTVMGKSKAHVFTKDESQSYGAGEKFSLGK